MQVTDVVLRQYESAIPGEGAKEASQINEIDPVLHQFMSGFLFPTGIWFVHIRDFPIGVSCVCAHGTNAMARQEDKSSAGENPAKQIWPDPPRRSRVKVEFIIAVP
jgi:hypothetical protein